MNTSWKILVPDILVEGMSEAQLAAELFKIMIS